MYDRRAVERWPKGCRLKIKLAGAQSWADCLVRDITSKGIQVSLAMKLPKDTFLSLSLRLSAKTTLELEAWVAWHKTVNGSNIYGLYFSQIKDTDKQKIYQFFHPGILPATEAPEQEMIKEGGEKMLNENFSDKRVFERFSVNMPVRFLDSNSNQESSAQTQDISAKGVGLVTKEKLPENAALEMWLEIPDKGEPLYTRGQVAWSRSTGINEYRSGINLERADLMGFSRVLRLAQ